ncbi:TPA: tyrosine-type recombinase/integrase [Salmonella enterica]|nr:tyrosine-type recombinase/integrase [Salmonella enterica]
MTSRNYLTRTEVEALLYSATMDAYHPERNHCMLLMAFVHGLRVSELLSLKISDIDISGCTLYIQRMKNGFSTIQPLLRDEITGIHCWMKIRATIDEAENSEFLFVSQKGQQLSRQQFYNIIKKTGERADLPLKVHPHMLRHACGYALADSGIDTRLIQDYLGHRNIQHTVLYTASNPARFEGVWSKFQRKCKGTFSIKMLTTFSVWTKCTFLFEFCK